MWAVTLENGNRFIFTTMGMSFMYFPAFVMGHTYATISKKYEANGYTQPYRMALIVNAFAIFFLGLIYLRKILLRYFSNITTAITIFAIGIGTNILHYATLESGMTHVYNFSLITFFLYHLINWEESKKTKYLIYLGLFGGLITLIRPTNILIYIIFLLWNVTDFKKLKKRFVYLLSNFKIPIILIIAFLIPWIPQMIYWKIYTGHFLFFSYGKNANFFWSNPQIINFLFSYWKGWYIYTPVMFVATFGFILLYKRKKQFFYPIAVYLVLTIYVLSSWWSWWYGGSFGSRSMIDAYAVMSFPFAAITEYMIKRKIIKWFYLLILINLIWYNVFQLFQYRAGAIHYWSMTKEMYWETFLKLSPTKRYWKIAKTPDYDAARVGIYKLITSKMIKFREKNYNTAIAKPGVYIDNYKNKIKENDYLKKYFIALYPQLSVEEAINKGSVSLYQTINKGKTKNEIILSIKNEIIKSGLDSYKQKASKQNVPLDTILNRNVRKYYNTNYFNLEQLRDIYITDEKIEEILTKEINYNFKLN